MSIDKTQTRHIIEDAIDKAREDDIFKRELIDDPLGAISSMTGGEFQFTEGKALVFVDTAETPSSTDSTYYINISTYGNLEDMELTQEQLEAITGGTEDLPLPFLWQIIIRL